MEAPFFFSALKYKIIKWNKSQQKKMLVRLSYGHSYVTEQVLNKWNQIDKTSIICMPNIIPHKLFSFM